MRCHVNFPIVSDGYPPPHPHRVMDGVRFKGVSMARSFFVTGACLRMTRDPGRLVVNRFGFQGENSMPRHGHDVHGDGICTTVCPPRHMVDSGSGSHQCSRVPRRRRQPLSFRRLVQPTCSPHMIGVACVRSDACRFWCPCTPHVPWCGVRQRHLTRVHVIPRVLHGRSSS